jgi:hypothetical protein
MPMAVTADPLDDFMSSEVRLDIAQKDLIPGIAAVRASCAVNASGEPLLVLANGSAHSTLAVSAGPCSIVLVLGGLDVAIPVFNTTPLGTSSFYLPGVSTVSLGIVDLSLDLVTSLNSTSWIEDGLGEASPQEIVWSSWGAQRIRVHGEDGFGSVAESHLRSAFTYRMSLALSVYVFSIRLFHTDLAEVGSAVGTPPLRTPFVVDLRPHARVLAPAEGIRSDRASLSWTGTTDSDVDHLELWLSDGPSEGMVRLPPSASRFEVLLRPSTSYRAWIVSVDASGQGSPSNEIVFESAEAPAAAAPVGSLGGNAFTWTLVALAIFVGLIGYAAGTLHGRKRD